MFNACPSKEAIHWQRGDPQGMKPGVARLLVRLFITWSSTGESLTSNSHMLLAWQSWGRTKNCPTKLCGSNCSDARAESPCQT